MELATYTDCGLAETEIGINAAGGSVTTDTVSVATSLDQINYFSRPNSSTMDMFFKFHPNQLVDDATVKKAFNRKDGSQRKWISYNAD